MHNCISWAGPHVFLKRGYISSRTESPTGSSNHDSTHGSIEFNVVQRIHYGSDKLIAKRIELFGPVQRKDCYGATIFAQEQGRWLSFECIHVFPLKTRSLLPQNASR